MIPRTKRAAQDCRKQIIDAAKNFNDADALDAIWMFEHWSPDVEYSQNDRIRYGDKLYRVQYYHTSQAQFPPSITTASLYVLVGAPNLGSKGNPIPHEIGMLLEYGKYYSEGGKLYFCYREGGSGNVPTTASLVYYAAFVQEVS